jgi:GH15 family glucan-1,4-alpha-glucosidase
VTTRSLIDQSIDIILRHQAETGAYLASPAFVHYRYAWLRDGAFTAYALDRLGRHESPRRFYAWCDSVVNKHADKAKAAIAAVHAGAAGSAAEANRRFLHARFTVDGDEVAGEWGSFQLDGYGTWLWGLAEHVRRSGERSLIERFRSSVDLTLDYLGACWQMPNFDCWEEHGDRIHPATLAAVYGGVRAMADCLPERAEELNGLADAIRRFVLERGTEDGAFVKSLGDPSSDASLLWLSLPFGLVDEDDPLMVRTVERIERELLAGCGVHRYRGDTYYGGGQWLLLSAWLGWYYVRRGRRGEAAAILRWIESTQTPDGLPEQVQEHLLAPDCYQPWVDRAGMPAVPLLWSHAMYLVLADELKVAGHEEQKTRVS